MRLASPNPCCGPMVSSVRRTIRSRVPWRMLRSLVDIQKEYGSIPFGCQEECGKNASRNAGMAGWKAAARYSEVSFLFMGRIRILPDQVANQIAAGEVVERPASVVKELLENSLDAGATDLRVEVEAGGRRLIRIVDDGGGMLRDDALLAFERHATSKLRNVKDPLSLAPLGVRGGAAPSIRPVSPLPCG